MRFSSRTPNTPIMTTEPSTNLSSNDSTSSNSREPESDRHLLSGENYTNSTLANLADETQRIYEQLISSEPSVPENWAESVRRNSLVSSDRFFQVSGWRDQYDQTPANTSTGLTCIPDDFLDAMSLSTPFQSLRYDPSLHTPSTLISLPSHSSLDSDFRNSHSLPSTISEETQSRSAPPLASVRMMRNISRRLKLEMEELLTCSPQQRPLLRDDLLALRAFLDQTISSLTTARSLVIGLILSDGIGNAPAEMPESDTDQ